MITEVAIFTAVAGKEDELGQAILRGIEVIKRDPQCLSVRVERCIEDPTKYMLTNTWTTLEAHTVGFRGGPLFPEWRSHINGLFEVPASVFHYQAFEKE